MLLPFASTLLLVTAWIQGVVEAVPVFGRCSATNPCDAPGVCVDNIICLPKEAPTPVFASAPFSLPVHASPLVLNLPEGLLHQNAPQTAIFLPPARINHSPPQVRPISTVFPVISRVVGEPVIDNMLTAPLHEAPIAHEPAYSFRSYPSSSKEYPAPQASPTHLPLETHVIPPEPLQEQSAPCPSPSQDPEKSPLSFFAPSIWQSSPKEYLPIARLLSNDDSSHQLSLPTARQISIDEVMEEELPKAKPIVSSFKSYPPPPSPSPISAERAYLATAPRLPAAFSIASNFAASEQTNSYLESRLPPLAPLGAGYTVPEKTPIMKMTDLRLRTHSVAARNPQALPGGKCEPSTECTGGSECVGGICQCPDSLMHQVSGF
ncbi:hypothetical protein PRIPAC_92079 [Pristionchus pacificus]|uniref:EB domain-containing protein n=1 Tax=Pristionchus pacificus TaxID=54126 RepID=A0A2A6CV18_PRIPA|nr:hypothetical protein PRIPAC_92079 [Pristionchus pacificus]|eukprot:PDM81968.1 hypothetical protein PRIPAC_33041 [Pristionchus pacificus]